MQKKILVLLCGGTLIMVENKEGVLAPPSQEDALQSFLKLEPKLKTWADIDVAFISNIDSSDMTPDLWDQIAQTISDRYSHYDGFVITHGTDTLAFTASALSFSLGNIGKPVIITGAQIPGDHLDSDAKRNVINAVRFALMDISGVYVVFDNHLILGARSTKLSHYKLEAFVSVNSSPVAEIGAHIEFLSSVPKRHKISPQLKLGFDPNITVISLVPGMPITLLNTLLESGVHGIVLIAYGTGNVSHGYLPFLKVARDKRIPIVITTQCIEGGTRMNTYETGKEALKLNAIEVYDMSRESTVTKLMWALKRAKYEEIRALMQQNLVGELRS